jgi:hypothetical protein
VPAVWVAVVLATQAWPSWSTGIREQFAGDVAAYEQIARAAPGLPSEPLSQQYAERFPIHWAIGTVADLTGADLYTVYRVAGFVLLLALVGIVALILRQLEADRFTRTVLFGLVVASAYPVRLLLAAPGMVADALFLVGLAVALWGFVAERDDAVIVGLLLAVLGRQTAVPVALVAGVVLAVRRRYGAAVAAAALPTLLYVMLHLVANRFSSGRALRGSSSIASALGEPHELASHLGRIALVLAVPVAVIGGAWLRSRVSPAPAAFALGAAIVVQAVVLRPEVVAKAEPRLTGLALPALAVAAAAPLGAALLTTAETAVLSGAILVSSFHARYSDVGVGSSSEWAILVLAGAVAIFVVLARGSKTVASSKSARTSATRPMDIVVRDDDALSSQ